VFLASLAWLAQTAASSCPGLVRACVRACVPSRVLLLKTPPARNYSTKTTFTPHVHLKIRKNPKLPRPRPNQTSALSAPPLLSSASSATRAVVRRSRRQPAPSASLAAPGDTTTERTAARARTSKIWNLDRCCCCYRATPLGSLPTRFSTGAPLLRTAGYVVGRRREWPLLCFNSVAGQCCTAGRLWPRCSHIPRKANRFEPAALSLAQPSSVRPSHPYSRR